MVDGQHGVRGQAVQRHVEPALVSGSEAVITHLLQTGEGHVLAVVCKLALVLPRAVLHGLNGVHLEVVQGPVVVVVVFVLVFAV